MNIPFCLAHTYIGHWTSRLARFIVRSGLIGSVRWVNSSYLQGWLAGRTEDTGSMQAEWRVDPKRAGISCCGGDIGTHALMQLLYVTGLEVVRVSAHLETFVSGRALDDHFTAYCELSNGGKAMIHASQIAIGHKNDLRIEVNGDKGTLVWRQEEPEQLTILLPNQPDRIYWRGAVSPNDGFFGDIPAELLAEVTIPPATVRPSMMLSRVCIDRSSRTCARIWMVSMRERTARSMPRWMTESPVSSLSAQRSTAVRGMVCGLNLVIELHSE